MRWVAIAALLLLASQASAQDGRGPINIYGDEDWLAGPANGVRSGSGTEGDPYVVSGWRIEPPLIDPRASGAAVHIENSEAYVVLRDLVIDQRFELGLDLFETGNVRLEGITLTNQDRAISLRNVHDVHVQDVVITQSGPHALASGIYAQDSRDMVFRVVEIRNGAGPGIRITQSSDVLLDGVSVIGHDDGIIIGSSSDVTLRGVLAGDNRGDGITLANVTAVDGRDVRASGQLMPASAQTGRGMVIWTSTGLMQGAIARDNAGDGARVWDGRLELRDSAFLDNRGHGLVLAQSDARAVAIEAHGNDGHGVVVFPAAIGVPHARILSLHSHDNQGAGLYTQGLKGFHLDVARMERNGGAGIDIRGTENVTVLHATLADNHGPGMLFVEVAGGQVVENQAIRNDEHGFSFRSSSDVLVRNNTASANGGSGFFLDGARLVLRQNLAAGNVGFGVDVQHTAQDALLDANTLVANGYGNQAIQEKESPAGFALALGGLLFAARRVSVRAASTRAIR